LSIIILNKITDMKRVITVLIMLNISIVLFSQETLKMEYNPASFTGTWIGTSGDKSYEFGLQKQIVYEGRESIEFILGFIKYLEKGKVARYLPVNELKSPLIGRTHSDTTAVFHYKDKEKGLRGLVKLILDPDDKNTVKWKLGMQEWSTIEEANFDLPREMILKRKK
jgi:hypothetical protein